MALRTPSARGMAHSIVLLYPEAPPTAGKLKVDAVYCKLKSAILRILQAGSQSQKRVEFDKERPGNLLDNPSLCGKLRPDCRQGGNYPETGLGEIRMQATFGETSFPTSRLLARNHFGDYLSTDQNQFLRCGPRLLHNTQSQMGKTRRMPTCRG
jgi:hypothetical protein